MKKHPIPIAEREYTVIEFGGSWCKPCNEILPQIEKLYEKVKDSIKVISIFKESNLQNAMLYFKKVKPRWDAYFEVLNCDTADCLAKLFGVGLYPTVILVDKTGKELFKATGLDCIRQLNDFLKNNLKKKV
jgi:thiol-disulfide isomerase/thioredoxin